MDYFDILLAKKLEDDRDPKVEGLSVTENGRYHEDGVVYDPVIVNVPETPLSKLTVTENGTYTAPSGTAYSEVDVDVPLPENAYLLKEIEDVEIASFNDGSDLPMPKLEVAIEPQQDLHGYDAPWVGGAGKNKLKVTATTTTKSGVTFTVKEDGTIVVTGTKSSSSTTRIWFDIAFNISFSEDVILNGCPSDGGDNAYKMAGFLGDTGTGDYNDIGSGVTIPADTMLKTLSIGIGQQGNINLVFKPMIRLASVSDATFAPYSNICPISGWDEVNVGDVGVNVWDEEWELGSIDTETGANVTSSAIIRSKNHILVNPNTAYYHLGRLQLYFYDKDKNYISYLAFANEGAFTTPSNAVYMRFTITSSYGTTYNNDISINYPSTDTSYRAYNGTTYTIDLDGTRYGGTLDVISGVLTVEKVGINVISQEKNSWQVGTLSCCYRINLPTTSTAVTSSEKHGAISNMLLEEVAYVGTSRPNEYGENKFAISTSGVILAVYDTDLTLTEEQFKTKYNDLFVVYPLATPLTIQLSPTVVKSLRGMNNVWADTGNILDLSYLAKEE